MFPVIIVWEQFDDRKVIYIPSMIKIKLNTTNAPFQERKKLYRNIRFREEKN